MKREDVGEGRKEKRKKEDRRQRETPELSGEGDELI